MVIWVSSCEAQLTVDGPCDDELLAATCHRLRALGGALVVRGLRHRLVSRPEVGFFPEIFGRLPRITRDARTT